MKPALALLLLLLVVSPAALAAEDAEIARGLENLGRVYGIAQILEFRQAMNTAAQFEFDAPVVDPWGTPYRIDAQHGKVVGAGSDRVFEAAEATANEQFDGLEGDVVYQGGTIFRSNRNWLYERVTRDGASGKVLQALRSSEILFMMMRTPEMRQLTAVRASALVLETLNSLAVQYQKTHGDFSKLAAAKDPLTTLVDESGGNRRLLQDAWGTPIRMTVDSKGYRFMSAGSDRKFDSASWKVQAGANPAEDVILENGAFVRRVDEKTFAQSIKASVAAVPQPPDAVPASHLDPAKWPRVGNGITAPAVIERVEPVYPENYRQLRLSGVLILECEVDANGQPGQIRVIKSVAPDFDMAGVEAVRKWKFSPAQRNGKPTAVLFNLTINFKLN